MTKFSLCLLFPPSFPISNNEVPCICDPVLVAIKPSYVHTHVLSSQSIRYVYRTSSRPTITMIWQRWECLNFLPSLPSTFTGHLRHRFPLRGNA